MKKLILLIFTLILIFFLIPVIFTKRIKTAETIAPNQIPKEEAVITKEYDYKKYNTINLLHTESGEIEQINLDEYLYGVVSAEMPADFENEALKAQAIVARTYTIYKLVNGKKHENADICDDSACCQAWISKEDRFTKWNEEECNNNWNKIVEAVNSTAGKIITYNGEPINAFFHANSGGKTEIVSNVWSGSDLPYLKAVETLRGGGLHAIQLRS